MMNENAVPQSCGRLTRSRAKKMDGVLTPGPATGTKISTETAAVSSAATPNVLFQDVTNTAKKQQLSSKKQPMPAEEGACMKQPTPAKAEQAGADSDVSNCSTETVKGSSNEEEPAGNVPPAPVAPQPEAQPNFDQYAAEKDQVQELQEASPAAEPEGVTTPERAPQQPQYPAHTASKAVQGQHAAASRTPRTTIKHDSATPALKRPEVQATPAAEHAAPCAGTPESAPKTGYRTLEKQVSISTPKEPKSATLARPVVRTPYPKADPETLAREEAEEAAEEAALQAEEEAAAAEAAQGSVSTANVSGAELFGVVNDEDGKPIGPVEYAGSEFNRELEDDMASPMPLTMSPSSPAVWSMPGSTPRTGSAAAPSPTKWSMTGTTPVAVAPTPEQYTMHVGATPATGAGSTPAAPTPEQYTMHAGATPAAGKSTAAPSPSVRSMAGATPEGKSTAAPSPSVWSMATPAAGSTAAFSPAVWSVGPTPMTMEQDMAEVPGSQFSTRTCAMGTGPRFSGFECEGDSEEDGVEEQVSPAALDSYVNAEAMRAQAQACMPYNNEEAAPAPDAVKPRLKSKVVASEAYDPRSLAQIRREIKEAGLKKKAASASSKEAQAVQVQNLTDMRTTPLVDKAVYDDEEEIEESEAYDEGDDTAVDDQLTAAMGDLGIKPAGAKPEALWGVPLPQGTHIRFDEEGQAMDSPTSGKPTLRGLPQATGQHIRFD